jgi:hypothetical protein
VLLRLEAAGEAVDLVLEHASEDEGHDRRARLDGRGQPRGIVRVGGEKTVARMAERGLFGGVGL